MSKDGNMNMDLLKDGATSSLRDDNPSNMHLTTTQEHLANAKLTHMPLHSIKVVTHRYLILNTKVSKGSELLL